MSTTNLRPAVGSATRWRVTREYEFDDMDAALAFYNDESAINTGSPAQFASASFTSMDPADSRLLNPYRCRCGELATRIFRNARVCDVHYAEGVDNQ